MVATEPIHGRLSMLTPNADEGLKEAWLRAHQGEALPSRRPDPVEVHSISSGDEESVYKLGG